MTMGDENVRDERPQGKAAQAADSARSPERRRAEDAAEEAKDQDRQDVQNAVEDLKGSGDGEPESQV
jgi:hypothetical protein